GHLMHGRRLVRLAGQREAAAVGRVQAGDDVEEGRLAGAVRADEAVDLTALDGNADVGQRLQAAEAFGNAPYFEDRFRHARLLAQGLIDMGREASPGTSSAGVSTPGWCSWMGPVLGMVPPRRASDLPCSGEGHRP